MLHDRRRIAGVSNELKFLVNNVRLLRFYGTRSFKLFIAVAEELHFAKAASRLHITPPALSRQIQQLEPELGLPLLYRTKQKVELLDAGHVLLSEAPHLATCRERGGLY